MIDFPIDLVLPYVNSSIKQWQETYVKFCNENGYVERAQTFNSERYRDWGYLRYMFRGISQNMPFIRTVYLILQDETQIPSWLIPESVKIIYHKDFMPEKYLPTYNSTSIEMFLDRIPGVAEHFIYANDDLFAMLPMTPEDFFTEDGKVKIGFRERQVKKEPLQFDIVCHNCYNMIQKRLLGTISHASYYTPYHEFVPMIKSHVRRVQIMFRKEIEAGITPFRHEANHNQYIYAYYELLTQNALPSPRTYDYVNMEGDAPRIAKLIAHERVNVFVLNDSEKTDINLWANNMEILTAFEFRWPRPSKYEKCPKVSICIPVYCGAAYITKCLETLPNREDIEIVIMDNASPDGTIDIASQYLDKYSKYQVLGVRTTTDFAFCKNTLLKKATGDYIYLMDSDSRLVVENFLKVVDNDLNDQDILATKYKDEDGNDIYSSDLRYCFVKRSYLGDLEYINSGDLDAGLVANLAKAHGGALNITQLDLLVSEIL